MRALATLVLCGTAVTGLCAAAAYAQGDTAPPNFAPTPDAGWIAYGGEFIPPASGPRPVGNDPAHPFSEGELLDFFVPIPELTRNRGPAQPTFRGADLSNPILQPWTREALRNQNDAVLAGKAGFNRQVACWPMGVPGFLLYPVQPVYFIQSPREVVMIWQTDHQVRRIALNVPHSANPKPSWYGESVGHYEGDTLVVDTIGITTKTFVDNYRTPHSDRLHVIERFRMIDGGNTLEVNVHVEDEGAFTTPFNAIQRYRRVEPGQLLEVSCAENNVNPFNWPIEPMPEAKIPDF